MNNKPHFYRSNGFWWCRPTRTQHNYAYVRHGMGLTPYEAWIDLTWPERKYQPGIILENNGPKPHPLFGWVAH